MNEQRLKGRNEEQIEYIDSLLSYVGQNRDFDRYYLTRDGLNHFMKLFNGEEIQQVMIDIESII